MFCFTSKSSALAFLFLSCLLFHPSTQTYQHYQQLKDLLFEWHESSVCPGTVAIFDPHYWHEEMEFLDELVENWGTPLTLLQSRNKQLVLDEDNWGGGSDSDPGKLLCTDVVIFNRAAQGLAPIYRQATERYPHIGQILVVTQGPPEYADRFLHEYGRTKYHIRLVMDRPWMRHLEICTCCYGPDRHVRKIEYVPTPVNHHNSDML